MSSSNVNHLVQPCIYGHIVSSYGERKSSFMRWLSKLFKGGGASGRRAATDGQRPRSFGDGNTILRAPSKSSDDRSRANKEKEELDRAVALSLDEDLSKPNGYKWRTANDEDLARTLDDSFNSAPYPPYAPRDYYPELYRKCGGCKREIVQGNYLGCMGEFFHPECFCCCACGYPITEPEFSLSGKDTYHKICFKELTHPKCEVCHQFIPTNGAGLIEYRCHPFWSQKYCPSHEHDNTARCCSCERLESWNTRYISLGDSRCICLECMESAIMDTGDCQPLYHSIRDYYEGLNMRIEQQIPMLLVERLALNEAIEGEKRGYHHMPETRGLCLSEEQTVTSVSRRPRMERCGLVGLRTQPQKLVRRCEVTAILVLYGLPRLLTGAILAHELMHGWLRLNGYRHLRPEVEEGICQVLAHLWLESEVPVESRTMTSTSTASSSSSSSSSSPWSASKKGGKSRVENKLGEFFMHQIAHDASPAYGGGYRAAMKAVNRRVKLNRFHQTAKIFVWKNLGNFEKLKSEVMEVMVPRVKLGSQGLYVSKQGLGCMGMSFLYGPPKPDPDMIKLIRHAVKSGVTFLDTSDAYGPYTNEILIGKALEGVVREKVQIATKFGLITKDGKTEIRGDPQYVRAACEASLKRLGVDYIDLYYAHRIDSRVPIEVTMGELKKLVEEGKVKYVGLSEASASTIRRAHAVHPLTAVQNEWSLWSRDLEDEIVPTCRELGIGIVAYSPLGRGFFSSGARFIQNLSECDIRKNMPRFQKDNLESNKVVFDKVTEMAARKGCTPSRLALAWVHHRGEDVCPIPGTTKIENLNQNVEALSVKLTPKEMAELESYVSADVVKGERHALMASTWINSETPPVASWKPE